MDISSTIVWYADCERIRHNERLRLEENEARLLGEADLRTFVAGYDYGKGTGRRILEALRLVKEDTKICAYRTELERRKSL